MAEIGHGGKELIERVMKQGKLREVSNNLEKRLAKKVRRLCDDRITDRKA